MDLATSHRPSGLIDPSRRQDIGEKSYRAAHNKMRGPIEGDAKSAVDTEIFRVARLYHALEDSYSI